MNSEFDYTVAVEAELNYVIPKSERTYMYTFDPPAGQPSTNAALDPRVSLIWNGRVTASVHPFEQSGFTLLHDRSAMRNFFDPDEVRSVYFPEAERLLVAATGADRAIVFDHTVRKHIPGAEDRKHSFRQPVHLIHVDYSDQSGPRRVLDLCADEGSGAPPARIQIVNLWRSMRDSLRDTPLAVCDVRSVASADYVAADLVYPTGPGEVLLLAHNPAHRWFYFPEMNSDEALIFKCYDSRQADCARFTPHSSFVDPTAPPDSPPRESIELRVLLIYREGNASA